ncbi:MAG: hypothetical protein OEY22_05595 [Candidatus Bathyarchaeota archaeon]|nr:hypothetical protein [Candidatus Bathyarchaeota archaeon]MDH5787961.1 hypothetical protein [Candidatus Bathyarchaeota archaeon]
MKDIVKKEVKTLGIKILSETHATVPFFLSETKELLKRLQEQDASSVDMELSVLYALANHYEKKTVGIIRIGDLPLKELPAWKSIPYKRQLKQEVHRKILNAILTYLF